MKIRYECDYCHQQFDNEMVCRYHEIEHLNNVDRLKYDIQYIMCEDICQYCAHAYYVYGCELNCPCKNCCDANNYKDFVPVRNISEGE